MSPKLFFITNRKIKIFSGLYRLSLVALLAMLLNACFHDRAPPSTQNKSSSGIDLVISIEDPNVTIDDNGQLIVHEALASFRVTVEVIPPQPNKDVSLLYGIEPDSAVLGDDVDLDINFRSTGETASTNRMTFIGAEYEGGRQFNSFQIFINNDTNNDYPVYERPYKARLNANHTYPEYERFSVRFGDALGGRIKIGENYPANPGFFVYIIDDEPVPQVEMYARDGSGNTVSTLSVIEGDGYVPLLIRLRNNQGQFMLSSQTIQIDCAVSSNTNNMIQGIDYQNPCPVAIPANQTSYEYPFLINDNVGQNSAYRELTINLINEFIGDAILSPTITVTASITDDDANGITTDTFLTACADSNNNTENCFDGSNFDPNYSGQDAQHSDSVAPFTTAYAGCNYDTHSNLLWEIKVNSGASLHAVDNIYAWYSPLNNRNGGDGGDALGDTSFKCNLGDSNCNTNEYIKAVNNKLASEALCGQSGGWRLPKLHELLSLVDYGNQNNWGTTEPNRYNARIVNYFTDDSLIDLTQPKIYWTSTPSAFDPDLVWVVDFTRGEARLQDKSVGARVRLVRSMQ
ncbi:MAG: DUF1566 domain-containing protein [Gammaproteobacteria bacterium]|nr:DUF1566 domain-containing protein [Gammaproteobacteria bacterium]